MLIIHENTGPHCSYPLCYTAVSSNFENPSSNTKTSLHGLIQRLPGPLQVAFLCTFYIFVTFINKTKSFFIRQVSYLFPSLTYFTATNDTFYGDRIVSGE